MYTADVTAAFEESKKECLDLKAHEPSLRAIEEEADEIAIDFSKTKKTARAQRSAAPPPPAVVAPPREPGRCILSSGGKPLG